MSELPRGNYDPKSLYNKMESAIEEDKLYWLRNDAKIRACVTSRSYDEFRDIVAAAHLTSLDKTDKQKKAKTGWNKCVSAKETE